jgi:metal-responsive CopG/Arc/MetJ family transcriptional regulator
MKTTVEIPDELLRKTKATAASRGETLREFINEALTTRLASTSRTASQRSGWRSVFGLAEPKAVQRVDALLESEVEQVDPSEWR